MIRMLFYFIINMGKNFGYKKRERNIFYSCSFLTTNIKGK